jgi:16S rRNA (adenine1518-N6/adenine1519-N6)-dimethyltransferase
MNNLTDIDYLKSFLKQSGLKPKHYLGQNFLVDQDALDAIIKAADLKKTDTVLEVGPGIGVLTQELAKYAGKVIAVEKDEKLISNFKFLISNLELIHQDILKFNIPKYITGPYKVVANIPYYLTSKFLQLFLQLKNRPEVLVLMIQKEVGERVVAKPGKLSVLGISVQVFADAEIVKPVPKESFWPEPKVDSVIIRVTPKNKYPEIKDEKKFFQIVKMAFAGKRKQLKNTLKDLEAIKSGGIKPSARPQELSIPDWIKLSRTLDKK